jgi:hypothetical protein
MNAFAFPRARDLAPGLACLLASGVAAAAPINIELNRLDPAGPNCRATIVVQNTEAKPVDGLKIDLVMFDTGGLVAKRLLVDVGALARLKTIVKSFELAELGCDRIGRVLLNDVPACGEAAASGCLDAVATSSRAAPPFDK